MTREMRELQAQLAAVEQEARLAIGDGKVEDAEKAMGKVRSLRKQIAMLDELETEEQKAAVPSGQKKEQEELETQYEKAFLKAVRRKSLSADEISMVNTYQREILGLMHEGGVTTDPDGDSGLIVPQDLQTKINEIMRELNDLTKYITFERVATLSGTRVLEADADMIPLQIVDEYGEIQAMDNPKFTPISYKLVKRAGYLPITNELLADSDQNIMDYLSRWIGRKVVVTRNALLLALWDAKLAATALADVDAIKKVLNVELDPAISLGATLFTNQDGYHWLDTQKDEQGRDLLQDDITQPGRKLLRGRPIVPISNRHLQSREDTGAGKTFAPIYIGNGKQFSVWFSRGAYELAATNVGGEAWRRDSTELRIITRDDLQQWDPATMVKGELDVTVAV